jgi:hypothetical protein
MFGRRGARQSNTVAFRNGARDAGATNHARHVGATAKEVAEHASAITRLELELALLEVKRKAIALGLGAAFAAGAALFLLFGLGFAFATIAAAIATAVAWWLALLIVTGLLLLLAAGLGVAALGRFRSGTPPVPKQAIREAKLTNEAIRR